MQSKFYIRLTTDSDVTGLRTLRVADDDTQPISTETALTDLAEASSGCRIIVIVPSMELILMSATVPSRNRQRILSAVPYLLEEQLASDVEQLHFVIGTPDAAGQLATAVVEHQKMKQWLAFLRLYGVEPHMLVADLCCLPVSEVSQWSLLLEGETALVSTGQNQGFAADIDNLVLMLRSALQAREKGAGAPEQLRLINGNANADGELALIEPLSEFDLIVSREKEVPDMLAFLAQGLDDKQALNLLQGPYSRRDQMGKLLRPWRASAAMLVVLLLFSGGGTVADYIDLGKQQIALKKHIEQTYLAACPGAKRIVNPRAQMEQCLKKMRGGGATEDAGLLVMLSSVGAALKAANGLQLQRISYRNGQLDMALMMGDIQGLDQLKQRIMKETALQVEILSASSRNGRIEARLQLKGKGS